MQQDQHKSQAWRELLRSLSMGERRRIIDDLGIQEKTLDRWISGHTGLPRPNHMRQLLTILPAQTRTRFIESVQQDPAFSKYATKFPLLDKKTEIPSTFYSRILEANAVVSHDLRFTITCQLVLLQAIGQLSSDSPGLFMAILKCTPPTHEDVVRTISEQFSLGTFPWSQIIEQKSFFLGAESIVGRAVIEHKPFVIQDTRSNSNADLLSIYRDEHTVSIAAFPIQKNERIGGCLLVRSTQSNFFTQRHLSLIQQYCHLTTIAMNDDEFYEQQQIKLRIMPPAEVQQKYVIQLPKRISLVAGQVGPDGHSKNWSEAKREVRHQIESELSERARKDL